MKIEVININDLVEYENNAKLHPEEQIEQIKNSIKEFGNNDPIAINKDNVIIEGHGRLQALKELGYEEVEVIKLDHLSQEQQKAYILAHNKLTMNTGFDMDILEEELASIIELDMEDFGFIDEDVLEIPDYDDSDEVKKSLESYLSFEGHKIPMTEEEVKNLDELYAKHLEETGINYGFVTRLLGGLF